MSTSREPFTDVHAAVLRLHDDARLTFREIARQLDLCPQRAVQIYHEAATRAADLAANGPHAICLLPGRARWILEHCGFHSRAEVRAAMESGELCTLGAGTAVYYRKSMLPSVSRKTWFALYDWAGRPEMPPCDRSSIYP